MGKLLFVFSLSQGHMNVCINLGKTLLSKYPGQHEVYFGVDEEFKNRIEGSSSLFKPVLMDKIDLPDQEIVEFFREEFRKNFYNTGMQRYTCSLEQITRMQDLVIEEQDRIEKLIEQVKPDVILMDQLFSLPFVENKDNLICGYIVSTNPLCAQNLPDYPPALSGLSADKSKDGRLWDEYRSQKKGHKLFEKRKKWFKDCNLELKDEDNDWLLSGTKYLNLYTYPEYADYPKLAEKMKPVGKWFRASHSIFEKKLQSDENHNSIKVKHPGKELLTPEFMAKPGHLILFSVGTIISSRAKEMQGLVDIIGSLPHKFVVSCGKCYDKIKLPDNCVGARFLDQVELYPIVDLCIVHGGNNTFCELFYYQKKPFILIPFVGDQLDNGARVNDLGIGISIELGDLGKQSLANAIERVTTDQVMKRKMEEAAKLSRSDNGIENFVDELHLYLTKQKK